VGATSGEQTAPHRPALGSEQTALRAPAVRDARITPRRSEVGTSVRRLLAAYAETLEVVERLPPIVREAVGWRWRSPGHVRLRLPRLSPTAYSQTVRHVDRVLMAAERSLLRRTAVGIGADADAEALEAVKAFRASLPSRSWVLRTSALVIAVLVVARALVALLPHGSAAWFRLFLLTGPKISVASIAHLIESTLGGLNPDTSSLGSAVQSLFNASLGALVASAGLLIVAAYIVLRPAMSAFRLKRLAFNLYPHADDVLREVPASWSVSRATGVYALEREAFAALGTRTPGELPLDLIVPLPAVLAYVGFVVLGLVGVSQEPESSELSLAFAALLYGFPAAIRLAWLAAVWRARRGGRRSMLLATEVSLPWTSRPARCRAPALIAFMSCFDWSWCLPECLWVWRQTTSDLRDLGRALEVKRLERLHPVGDALFVSFFFLPFGPMWRAPGRVRTAQQAVGLESPASRFLLLLLPVPPLLCFLLQRQLNRLWEAAGSPIDSGDAIASQIRALTTPKSLA
jgi:hypothetical protein